MKKAGLLKQVSQLVDNLEKDEVRRLITEEKYVLMVVRLTKFVHYLQKSTYYHVFTVLVYSLVDKRKH